MKTAKEFRDDYAIDMGYPNWTYLVMKSTAPAMDIHVRVLMEQYAREYARSIQLSDEEIKEMFTEVRPLRPKDRKMVNWDSFESARKYKQQILNKL